MKDALYKKFDNIKMRKGRGGSYPYISSRDVFDRMNTVFGVSWSSQVESQEIVGNNVVIRVRVSVTDPETGRVYSQDGFGAAPNDDRLEPGSPFKAAYSKAVKSAVKMWGVGLYLEEDEDGEHETVFSPAEENFPSGFKGKEYGVPPASAQRTEPVAPPVNGGLPTPPGVSMTTTPEVSVQPVETPPTSVVEKPTIPMPATKTQVIPIPPMETKAAPTPPRFNSRSEMPMSKVVPIRMAGPEYISDVQKVALHSILDKSGVPYETLVKEAFEFNGINKNPIPEMDKITYDDAVKIVKYGNDKFRNR